MLEKLSIAACHSNKLYSSNKTEIHKQQPSIHYTFFHFSIPIHGVESLLHTG